MVSCGGNQNHDAKDTSSKYLLGEWETRVEDRLWTFDMVCEFKKDHSYRATLKFPYLEQTGLFEEGFELTFTAQWRLKDGSRIVLSNFESDDPDFSDLKEELEKEYEKEGDIIIRLNEKEMVIKGEEREPNQVYKKINRSLFLTIFLFVGMACMLGGAIGIIIKAFKTSIIWGVGCIVIALLQWVFVATHWKRAWKPFLIQVIGFAIMFCTGIITEKTGLTIYRF